MTHLCCSTQLGNVQWVNVLNKTTNHIFSRTVVGLASFNTSTISQVTFPTGWFLYNVELSVTEFTADTVVNQVCTHAVPLSDPAPLNILHSTKVKPRTPKYKEASYIAEPPEGDTHLSWKIDRDN